MEIGDCWVEIRDCRLESVEWKVGSVRRAWRMGRVENGEWGVVSWELGVGSVEGGGGGGKPRGHNTQHQPLTHTKHGVECQQSGSGGDVVVAKIDNLSLESLKWVRGQCMAAESFWIFGMCLRLFFSFEESETGTLKKFGTWECEPWNTKYIFCKRRRNKKAKSRKTGREGISETRACSSLENTGLKCINERLLVRLKFI